MNKNKLIFLPLLLLTVLSFIFSKPKISFAYENKMYLSKAYCLMDANSGTIIISGNETEHLPIASMCKIMTLNLCFDEIENNRLSMDDTVIISQNASGMGGSQVYLEQNGQYKVFELIKSIVVASANDSCIAMAEHIYGSEELFVQKMNEKAKLLNMNDTNFVNATGLPKPGQYSCAKDCAIMFKELLSHKDYFKFSTIWMDKIEHQKGRITEISNTNKLIRFYNGCDAGKTGYTSEAGHCLSASAIKNGMRLIAVVIKSPDSKTRFKEVSDIFNYGFANFMTKTIIDNEKPLNFTAEIENGKKECVELIAENSFSYLCKKDEKTNFEIDFELNKNLSAPINKFDQVGKINIYKDGTKLTSINILANENISKKSYVDYLEDIIKNWKISV